MSHGVNRTLAERVKELNCLYSIARITERRDLDLAETLRRIVAVIPEAWQFPDKTGASIQLKNLDCRTENFRDVEWVQNAKIIADRQLAGQIKVCYLEQMPESDEGPFLKEERNLLNVIAQRVGEIVEQKNAEAQLLLYQEQLRSLAQQITRTEERERRRIASRLHDDVGHVLATARINLAMALKSSKPEVVTALLEKTNDLVGQAIREARDIILDISPPVLYELGLAGALEWAAERISNLYGFQVKTVFDMDAEVEELEIRSVLFQIGRELLTNIGKHARASRARLSLRLKGGVLSLDVEDDGIGFDVSAARARMLADGYFGIFNVREQIQQLGGTLVIDTAPGAGTRVRLTYEP